MTTSLRIASLVPSVTELLVALGLGPCLVARTGFCIHPAAELSDVPKVGGTKDVRLGALRQLAPSHVVVNVDENRLETVEALRSWGVQEVVTHPNSPEDVRELIAQLVRAFAEPSGAADEVRRRAGAIDAELCAELAQTGPARGPPVPVLYLIWRGPWMTVARDTYISRLLDCVGWQTRPDAEGGSHGAARYPTVLGSEPWLADVEQVLLSSEPYSFTSAHVAEAQALCPRSRVRLVDGEALSWYGVRTASGLRYLRQLLG